MIWLWLILLSVVSACLYRMGGCGPADLQKEWGWVPGFIRNFPKKRDVGCNVLFLLSAYLVGVTTAGGWWNLLWLLSFGLVWASLSTYWDELFGYDNHWFHGFMIGFSLLPILWGSWIALGVVSVFLAVTMGLWSKVLGNATWEELGRGFFMPISLGAIVLLGI